MFNGTEPTAFNLLVAHFKFYHMIQFELNNMDFGCNVENEKEIALTEHSGYFCKSVCVKKKYAWRHYQLHVVHFYTRRCSDVNPLSLGDFDVILE